MIIRISDERILDETRFSPKSLIRHVDEHFKEYINDERFNGIEYPSEEFTQKYDEIADLLTRTKVSPSKSLNRYVGFINKDGMGVKYDRTTMDFVLYKHNSVTPGDPSVTVTMHKKSPSAYNNARRHSFKKEFSYNEQSKEQ